MATSDGASHIIVPYGGFTAFTPTLPEFYWDVYSSEQRIKHICFEIDKLVEYADMLGTHINLDHDSIVELQELFVEFQNAGLASVYETILQKWIDEKMPSIIKASIKTVYFGLTDDGYFCAYIPDSWSDIKFDTGAVYGTDTYGRLILRMQVDSSS